MELVAYGPLPGERPHLETPMTPQPIVGYWYLVIPMHRIEDGNLVELSRRLPTGEFTKEPGLGWVAGGTWRRWDLEIWGEVG